MDNGLVAIGFYKLDGTQREYAVTTKRDLIPAELSAPEQGLETINFYVPEIGQYRSCHIANIYFWEALS